MASSSPPPNPNLSNTQINSSKTQSNSDKTQINSPNSEPVEPETSSIPIPEKDPETQVQEEEEEEGECGFCLFMKGGGCKDSFVAWEKCIEEAEEKGEDIVDKCFEVTGALKKCMEAFSDYYAPILQAEKAAEAEVVREMEKEKAEGEAAKETKKD